MVTTYQDAPAARIVVEHRDGTPPAELPVVHRRGALVIDLGATGVDRVHALRVDWPSASLRAVSLIDTPGVDSTRPGIAGRARAFLGATDPAAPGEGADIASVLCPRRVTVPTSCCTWSATCTTPTSPSPRPWASARRAGSARRARSRSSRGPTRSAAGASTRWSRRSR